MENLPLLYTPAEAAELLKLKESWLRRAVQDKSIPHTKVGKHLRFSVADLAEIVTTSRQPVEVVPARRKGAA